MPSRYLFIVSLMSGVKKAILILCLRRGSCFFVLEKSIPTVCPSPFDPSAFDITQILIRGKELPESGPVTYNRP